MFFDPRNVTLTKMYFMVRMSWPRKLSINVRVIL